MVAHTTGSKKAKGTKLERRFAKMLVDSGLDRFAQRMPGSGAIAGLKQDIYTKLPFAFECKNQETWKPYEWYQQAVRGKNIGSLRVPVVVMSRNNIGDYVFLEAQDFITLLIYALAAGYPDAPLQEDDKEIPIY